MYHGEVNVAQEELNSFLSVAEDLRVKGLTQNQGQKRESSTPKSEIPSKSQLPPSTRPPVDREREQVVVKKPRPPAAPILPQANPDDDDIQEVMPVVKAEPKEASHTLAHHQHQQQPHYQETQEQSQVVAHEEYTDNTVATYADEAGYDDYGQYEATDQSYEASYASADGSKGQKTDTEAEFDIYLRQNSSQTETGQWQCHLCAKVTLHFGNLRQHFEASHFSIGQSECQYCGKLFKTKHSLASHVYRVHKDRK